MTVQQFFIISKKIFVLKLVSLQKNGGQILKQFLKELQINVICSDIMETEDIHAILIQNNLESRKSKGNEDIVFPAMKVLQRQRSDYQKVLVMENIA